MESSRGSTFHINSSARAPQTMPKGWGKSTKASRRQRNGTSGATNPAGDSSVPERTAKKSRGSAAASARDSAGAAAAPTTTRKRAGCELSFATTVAKKPQPSARPGADPPTKSATEAAAALRKEKHVLKGAISVLKARGAE